jgi:hypothetical protein
VDSVYLDSLISDATLNNDTALLAEIHTYLDTLGCDWWPSNSMRKNGYRSENDDPIFSVVNPEIGKSIKIYPNPAHESFTVELPDNTTAQLQIIDLIGKVLYQTTIDKCKKMISLDKSIAPGNYLIKLTATDFTYTERISIIR